ncbi:MAG: hypothetical protein WCF67_16730 [Chitinophagaceae bacterium]
MKTIALCAALLITLSLQAQTIDSLDNIVLKIPAGWQINKQSFYTQLTAYDSHHGFCQMVINPQQPSTDKHATFLKEWSDVVLASYQTTVKPNPQPKSTSTGTVLSFGAEVTDRTSGAAFYVELNMFDCGTYVQSVMLTSGNQQHLQFFDASWQLLITGVKKRGATQSALASGNQQ